MGGLALAGLASRSSAARVTEFMTIGPFYPSERELDEDDDLTVVNGIKTRARGQIVNLSGRVLKADGTPAAGARVELWQANAAGRYAHPADRTDAPLDPGFQGFGVQLADDEGRYRFRTIKPGAYSTPGGLVRTPHLHFDVRGRTSRTVTQMFFPGEAQNAEDFLLKAADDPETLMAKAVSGGGRGPLALSWDIVLVDA